MDEGRLGLVVRQEERHRKFVYMMNDIVRAQLGLYSNCLAREQHEASIKLVSSCVEVRRSIVKQKVLRKCLEMRKRKVMARDSLAHFGQYGGKPLWAMSRDIERVIADNHPRIRRIRRAEEMMRQSLENGAILDEDAVARRMEAFFQVKQGRQQQQQQNKKFATALQNPFKLPPLGNAGAANRLQAAQEQRLRYEFKDMSLKKSHAKSANKENTTSDPRPQKDELSVKETKHKNIDTATSGIPSLKMDRNGRLVGVRTSHLHNAADVIEEKDEEHDKTEAPDAENEKNTGKGSSNMEQSRNEDNGQNMDNGQTMDNEQNMETPQNMDNVQNGKHARRVGVVKPPKEIAATVEEENGTDKNSKVSSQKPHAQNGEKDESQPNQKSIVSETSEEERGKPRSTLILPPIETSKALVSRK